MKLSELITTLQAAMDEHGDTDEIALCFVIEGRPAHRLDVFGSVTVLHDTGEHPNGMAYLVADCNQQPACLAEGLITAGIDVSGDRVSVTIAEPSNVELTGAARLYRAASSDRRERG